MRSCTDSSDATKQQWVETLKTSVLSLFSVLASTVKMPSSGDKTARGHYPFVVRLTVTSVKSMEVTV